MQLLKSFIAFTVVLAASASPVKRDAGSDISSALTDLTTAVDAVNSDVVAIINNPYSLLDAGVCIFTFTWFVCILTRILRPSP